MNLMLGISGLLFSYDLSFSVFCIIMFINGVSCGCCDIFANTIILRL